MALKAGTVGVKWTEVDNEGNILDSGGGGGGSAVEEVQDATEADFAMMEMISYNALSMGTPLLYYVDVDGVMREYSGSFSPSDEVALVDGTTYLLNRANRKEGVDGTLATFTLDYMDSSYLNTFTLFITFFEGEAQVRYHGTSYYVENYDVENDDIVVMFPKSLSYLDGSAYEVKFYKFK